MLHYLFSVDLQFTKFLHNDCFKFQKHFFNIQYVPICFPCRHGMLFIARDEPEIRNTSLFIIS